jgi:hypothetical protein
MWNSTMQLVEHPSGHRVLKVRTQNNPGSPRGLGEPEVFAQQEGVIEPLFMRTSNLLTREYKSWQLNPRPSTSTSQP